MHMHRGEEWAWQHGAVRAILLEGRRIYLHARAGSISPDLGDRGEGRGERGEGRGGAARRTGIGSRTTVFTRKLSGKVTSRRLRKKVSSTAAAPVRVPCARTHHAGGTVRP